MSIMGRSSEEQGQALTVLTWDSQGMIHYVDAVRGALWTLRNESGPDSTRAWNVQIVSLKSKRKRRRYSVARQTITVTPAPTPSVAIGVREIENAQTEIFRSLVGASVQGLAVLFGRKVVRESHSRRYEKQPVLTFGRVQVGDLIASEFYANPQPSGRNFLAVIDRTRERMRLARVTYNAHLTYAKSLKTAKKFCTSRTVVFATEWTYTHEILSRVCETLYQTPCVYRNNFGYFFSSSNLQQIPETGLFIRPASVTAPAAGTSDQNDEVNFESGTARATSPPLSALRDNGSSGTKWPRGGARSIDEESRSVIAVFLHDVRDAQYECGVDGYQNIQQWASITLSKLSSRADITVLAKPHPNILGEQEGGPNRDFLRRLSQQFPHVCWIPPHVSLEELLSEFGANLTVVSHHGTVGYEMAQRGLVALVSGLSPYGNYPLARYWQTRQEYEGILANSPPNLFTMSTSADSVLEAAEHYALNVGHGRTFVPTYRVLGSLAGNTFPDGIYADQWMETWKVTAKSAQDRGLKACIEACLALDLDEIASRGQRE